MSMSRKQGKTVRLTIHAILLCLYVVRAFGQPRALDSANVGTGSLNVRYDADHGVPRIVVENASEGATVAVYAIEYEPILSGRIVRSRQWTRVAQGKKTTVEVILNGQVQKRTKGDGYVDLRPWPVRRWVGIVAVEAGTGRLGTLGVRQRSDDQIGGIVESRAAIAASNGTVIVAGPTGVKIAARVSRRAGEQSTKVERFVSVGDDSLNDLTSTDVGPELSPGDLVLFLDLDSFQFTQAQVKQ